MPHLLVERVRSYDFLSRRKYRTVAYIIEALDVFAGFVFVVGSLCFIPGYWHDINVFLAGCAIFVWGSLLYVVICSFTLIEAYVEKGQGSWEVYENSLYWVGSWAFFVGSILYWPEESQYELIEAFQHFTLPQYFNLFSPEFEGTLLFIVGSVLFTVAAFINLMNQPKSDDLKSTVWTCITLLYLVGSLLFIGGSVAFLPDLGCGKQMMEIGAWAFVIGSLFFLIGAVMSLIRTIYMIDEEAERLVSKDVALTTARGQSI